MLSLIFYICEDDSSKLLNFSTTFEWDKNDREWNLLFFNLLTDIIRMIRVRGKKLPDNNMTGEKLYSILEPYINNPDEKNDIQIEIPEIGEGSDVEKTDNIKALCSDLGCWTIGTTLTKCTNDSIEEIDIPHGITQISDGAFSECKRLKRVRIPDSVIAIQKGAFEECTSLEDIVIPNSVEILWQRAFRNCTSLKQITLPDRIKVIKDRLFLGCTNLTHVVIPEGITSIERYAFCGCSSLREIELPSSIEKIYSLAFQDCENLSQVFINSNIHIEKGAFPAYTKLMKNGSNGIKIREQCPKKSRIKMQEVGEGKLKTGKPPKKSIANKPAGKQ